LAQTALSDDEVAALSRSLTRLLGTATPHDAVAFYFEQDDGTGLWRITSGAVFVRDGRVHVLLANYRYVVSVQFVKEQIRQSPLRPAGETYYEPVPGPSDIVRAFPDERRFLAPARSGFEVIIDHRAALSGGSAAGSGHRSGDAETKEGPEGRLEERLRGLERLRDRGVITEEEYRRKRGQVLDAY
jgi:hypothetical protein